MTFVLSHLWFAVIPLGLLNVIFLYFRARKHLSHDPELKKNARRAVYCLAVAMAVTASFVGAMQLMGGFQNPFYIYSSNLDNPYILTGKIAIYVFWVAVLVWAWFTEGLVNYTKLFFLTVKPYEQTLLRGLATLVCVGGITALTFYNGSAVAVVINNYHDAGVEWVQVDFAGGESRLGAIEPDSRAMTTIKPQHTGEVSVTYKLLSAENAYRARMPFQLGDISMGFVELSVTEDGKLGVRDRVTFK